MWLGLAGICSGLIFGWMTAYTRIGDRNPIGETYKISAQEFQNDLNESQEAADERADGALIPVGTDGYVGESASIGRRRRSGSRRAPSTTSA